MIGWSDGFALRYVGLFGMPVGNRLAAALIAACTSRAAPSMFFDSSNCTTMVVLPSELLEVIWVIPEMRPSERSSGVATDDAMVSGLAPGIAACTMMVGKSTLGSGATGSRPNERMPASSIARVSSVVATGRRMNGREMFISPAPPRRLRHRRRGPARDAGARRSSAAPGGRSTGRSPAW
ncbi:hypothetical protein D9M69_388750 [compost metagenome]